MRFVDITARRPAVALAIFILATAIAIWGNTRERADRRINSPRAKAHHEFSNGISREFGRDGTDVLILVDQLGRGDLFDRESARALRKLLEDIRALPEVLDAYSFDQIPAYSFGLVPRPLLPEPDDSDSKHAACRERALEHPVVAGNLLSEDARTALIPLAVKANGRRDAQRLGIVEKIEATAAAATAGSPVRARLIGHYPIDMVRRAAMEDERTRFQLIGFGLSIFFALLLFRGLLTPLVAVLPPVTGVLWTLGVVGFTGVKLSPLSLVLMPIILTMIGFTNAAHLVFHIRKCCLNGLARRDAVRAAMAKLGVPCLLSALTTAAGFASLMSVEADLVNDFGRDCAIGTVLTFLAVVTLVPLLALSPVGSGLSKPARATARRPWGVAAFFENFVEHVFVRAPAVVGVTVVLTALFAWKAATLKPDISLSSQLPGDSPSADAMRHVDRELGGIQVIRLVAEWPEEIDATENAAPVLDALAELEALVENEPLLSPPLSIRAVLASMPGLRKDLSRRVHLLERAPPQTVSRLYRPDLRRALVATRAQDLGVAQYAPVYDRLDLKLAELEEAHPGWTFKLAGGPVGWGRYLHRMANELYRSLGIAAVIILLMITIAYRSPRIGLIATLPNFFPLLATAAALAFLGMPLSLAVVCALTVCLGIAADDSIHFISRYRSERSEGADTEAALRIAFLHVGHVLVITTIVMVSGIGAVLFSDLEMFRAFALVACLTLVAALIADLIILPALLKIFARHPPRKREPG